MPKKKSQRNSREVVVQPARTVKPWVRWSAIIVIFALLLSIMLAAITSAPSSAATPTATATICKPIDTDGDGIKNNNDADIDGDNIVNGRDEDIDGDGVVNGSDNDPLMAPQRILVLLGSGLSVSWQSGLVTSHYDRLVVASNFLSE